MRELRVEDALMYLDQVKMEFGTRPHVYNEFLYIMKTFKSQQIDTPGVIRRVTNLFKGNKQLVLGFNTFLPEGYKIEIPDNQNSVFYRAPGQHTLTRIHTGPIGPLDTNNASPQVGPGAAQETPPAVRVAAKAMPHMGPHGQSSNLPMSPPNPPSGFGVQHPGPGNSHPVSKPSISPQKPPHTQQHVQQNVQQPPPPPPPPQAEAQAPIEFDHAINYVTTIKRRFSSDPDTYKKFLEILHTYQREQKGIKEVLDEVSILFADHPDLLKDFTYFLPDAVQEQAKVQLAKYVREAENRRDMLLLKQSEQKRAMSPQKPAPPITRVDSASMYQEPQIQYPPPPQVPLVPFGAKEARSAEREQEICRSAIYGIVSFDPVRPPRKHEYTPAQAASRYGRPKSIPEAIIQPFTKEVAFFDRAKEHLNRKELAAVTNVYNNRRQHTPWTEFLKCLHLFGAGILQKKDILTLLPPLFKYGHAPKSVINATPGSAAFQEVIESATALMKEFEDLLVSRGPYARQQVALKNKSKYGAITAKEWDPTLCDEISPSYRTYPSDYPYEEFYTHSGQTEEDAAVLNTDVVCVRNERRVPASKMRLLDSLEEYDGIAERRNMFEQALAKVEDERFEVDIVIETNGSAMKQIEPYAEEVSQLRENEEKEGQPIGRLHYELRPKSLHSNHLNSIARLYGEQGDEVLQHLLRNPIAVLPILFKRLKEKDTEWRKVRTDLCKQWRVAQETNYEPSLDITSYFNRRDIEKSFHSEDLIEDCQKARQFAKEPPIMPSVTDKISATFSLEHENHEMLLFQSYASVSVTPEMPHKDAYELISLYTVKNVAKTNAEREKSARFWTEFMLPWFNFPTHWFLKELRDKARSEKSSGIVKYKLGQMVKTAFGNGRIVSFVEAGSHAGAHYKVKLPFGTGYIRPSSIVHHLPSPEQLQYVRSGGIMELLDADDVPMDGDEAKLLPSSCQLIFGTEKLYLFMRMYCALVGLLNSIQNDLSASSNDMEIEGIGNKRYAEFLSIIRKYIEEKYSFKTYELQCHSLLKTKPYEMAAVPRLLDKCADFLVKVAKEDKVLNLYDFYQWNHMNPSLQRLESLHFTEEAAYRIQFEASDGKIHFCYMPKSRDMHMTSRGDDGTITSDGEDNTGGEEDDLDSSVNDGDEVVDNENGVKSAKRMRLE